MNEELHRMNLMAVLKVEFFMKKKNQPTQLKSQQQRGGVMFSVEFSKDSILICEIRLFKYMKCFYGLFLLNLFIRIYITLFA